LMSVNRFVLILFPTRPILHEKRMVQYGLSALLWAFSFVGAAGFFIGRCERRILSDGTFVDACPRSLGYNGSFAEYIENPGLYDAAQTIRNIIIRCYDVLPVLAFVIYVIITLLILKRK
ncbi:hypothetical protein PMAYCL1PPCAC_15076, partial [Pristionchus mayeri]